ncbi:hypothetical protein [Candidatus Pyrohabitans sp.]
MGDDINLKENIEKLKKSFRYIKGCVLINRDGEVTAYDVDDYEELTFKLSILFDLDGLEEILIERGDGAHYIKVFGDTMIYLDFTRKPNVPLLNMYLKKIIGGVVSEKRPEKKSLVKQSVQVPGEETHKKTYDDVLSLVISDYFFHGQSAVDIAREFRKIMEKQMAQNSKIKRGRVMVTSSRNGEALELFVNILAQYSGGLIGTRDRALEDKIRKELEEISGMAAEEVGQKFGITTRAKCFVDFKVKGVV